MEPIPRSPGPAWPLTYLVLLSLPGVGAQVSEGFQLQQPQDKVSVTAGETLNLTCISSGYGPAGPLKWLKGWGMGNETVYDQNGVFPRVTRAEPGSNTDFSIYLRDVGPEDAGIYYCVKFRKRFGGDEVFQHGKGTEVSLHETALVPGMVAAVVVLCCLLLLGLLIAFCIHRRKQRGQAESHCLSGPAAMGSFLPVPLRCCARTPSTPRKVPDAETSHLSSQLHRKNEHEIHYADLQPLPTAPRHGRTLPPPACSEYASVQVAAK